MNYSTKDIQIEVLAGRLVDTIDGVTFYYNGQVFYLTPVGSEEVLGLYRPTTDNIKKLELIEVLSNWIAAMEFRHDWFTSEEWRTQRNTER